MKKSSNAEDISKIPFERIPVRAKREAWRLLHDDAAAWQAMEQHTAAIARGDEREKRRLQLVMCAYCLLWSMVKGTTVASMEDWNLHMSASHHALGMGVTPCRAAGTGNGEQG